MLLFAESSTPLLNIFWWMLWFFMFVIWISLLISIFADIFRSDISGFGKAAWIFFVVILPFLGVLVYLIANGSKMQERSLKQAADMQKAQDNYIKSVAGSGGSTADELDKLSRLHDAGTLTDAEFAAQKAKLLG
ncbi:MAG: SHOCT domain-containing protein [Acidimicrobiia bacterium]|nr:SHOCT domain-containing protein [Acidimicrobiia bacterium]